MNLKKSELAPTQDFVYIGARFRTDLGRLYLLVIWIQAMTACVRFFSIVGAYKSAHQFLSLLGLMAAMLQSVEYAHLHMRPIQWYLKLHWNHTCTTHGLCHPIFVIKDLVHMLLWLSEQAAPVPGTGVYISQHHHHYHYGCEHGGVGWPLYCAQVRHSTVQ